MGAPHWHTAVALVIGPVGLLIVSCIGIWSCGGSVDATSGGSMDSVDAGSVSDADGVDDERTLPDGVAVDGLASDEGAVLPDAGSYEPPCNPGGDDVFLLTRRELALWRPSGVQILASKACEDEHEYRALWGDWAQDVFVAENDRVCARLCGCVEVLRWNGSTLDPY